VGVSGKVLAAAGLQSGLCETRGCPVPDAVGASWLHNRPTAGHS